MSQLNISCGTDSYFADSSASGNIGYSLMISTIRLLLARVELDFRGNAIKPQLFILLLFGAILRGHCAELESDEDLIARLRSIPLDEILHSTVTTAAKKEEDWFESPSATFVITNDDIRRSGARSIPEALRMAPGLQVARSNAHTWAISSRGFNDIFADKLLVLMDGRTLFSPIFNGVYWNITDYLLEDIERIEVVRGPGGTLWGANAVNGVINIITKNARDTEGTYVTGGAGFYERGFAGARYGVSLGENGFLRGYTNFNNRDDFPDGDDSWDLLTGGLRADWDLPVGHLMIKGDLFYETHDELYTVRSYTPPYLPQFSGESDFYGGNLLARFEHEIDDESEVFVQAYYDGFRNQVDVTDVFDVTNQHDILDIEAQHRFPLVWQQSVTYGLGYRYLPTELGNNQLFTWSPEDRREQRFNVFVQDEISLIENELKFTFGSKFEHNDATDWEVQPSGRIVWLPTQRQTLWGSVSRAISVPARTRDIIANNSPVPPIPAGDPPLPPFPMFIRGMANPHPTSQEVLAYELGYRIQPTETPIL